MLMLPHKNRTEKMSKSTITVRMSLYSIVLILNEWKINLWIEIFRCCLWFTDLWEICKQWAIVVVVGKYSRSVYKLHSPHNNNRKRERWFRESHYTQRKRFLIYLIIPLHSILFHSILYFCCIWHKCVVHGNSFAVTYEYEMFKSSMFRIAQ